MKRVLQIALLGFGLLGSPLLWAYNLFAVDIESVTLVEDLTAQNTLVEVKTSQSLHSAAGCTDKDNLTFVYDDLTIATDDASAGLFMYSLLLTAKSTGLKVDMFYSDVCTTGGQCAAQCVINSVEMKR